MRWQWLAGLAMLAFSAAGASAQTLDHVSLRLNTILYGFHSPFFLGVDQGIYRRHGIDLAIGEGQGSARAVQTVGAGSDTFGLSDSSSIISGIARGVPVQAVMGIMNRSPFAVIVRKDSGITSIEGLRGKTLAATTGEAGLVIFPAILRKNKLADGDIRFLRVDQSAKLVAVLESQTAGCLGGIENQALILPQRGTPVTVFSYADLGVNTVGLAIHTSTDTIARNPDLVRRFIAATREAFEAAQASPDASVAALLKTKPDMDRALALAQLNAGLTLLKSPRGAAQPVGWMAGEDWAETLALMKEFQDLHTDLPATAFWTDGLLPK